MQILSRIGGLVSYVGFVAQQNPLFLVPARNIMRKHFTRPSDNKRIKRHGYFARLKTPGGRLILMRRFLKGRHVLSH